MPKRVDENQPIYVRFQILSRDEHSHSKKGVFQAAFELRESGQLTDHETIDLDAQLKWLQMHLKSPDCLRERGNERAIAWFHPRAHEPIRRVRRMVAILHEHGFHVEQVTTTRPGKVMYEDGWQIVAKPFRY